MGLPIGSGQGKILRPEQWGVLADSDGTTGNGNDDTQAWLDDREYSNSLILQIVINSAGGRDISIGLPENIANDFYGKLLYMIKLQNGQKADKDHKFRTIRNLQPGTLIIYLTKPKPITL